MNKQTRPILPLLELKSINRTFADNDHHLKVLDNVHLSVQNGEKIAIIGPSGSGKSTLLYLMGLLDKPTTGQVLYQGKDMAHASDLMRSKMRQKKLGFVYQYHYLLPEFTALENVLMPAIIAGRKKHDRQRAKDLLARMGLTQRLTHYPAQLSGGEQQRVAVARALLNHPEVIFADEPTGNLDTESAETVYRLFDDIIHQENAALVLVTHNRGLAQRCDKIYTMAQGRCILDA